MSYTAVVPDSVAVSVGSTTAVMISLKGDGPVHLGDVGLTNRDIQVRFTCDPSVVEVLDCKPLQQFLPSRPAGEEFDWARTRSTGNEYVINQRVSYPIGSDPVGGFDVAMGGLYEVTIKGLKTGSTQLVLTKCSLGNTQPSGTANVKVS